MGGTGVDPNVERVAAASERGGGRPVGRERNAREDFGRRAAIPEVGADSGKLVCDRAGDAGVEVGDFLFVVERGDRHAPRTLAADTPVGARFDRAADAGFAPRGNPTVVRRDFLDFSERQAARGRS